ncbi:hypothetical protein CERSUDRAFT_87057 [Gelatoporia subvermispora B]|uniref:Uncharacterized protein n=1 Tax=Ceriporiopsis subvermispora (strain B) TaxID=914234 RepID=M2Q9Z5_CERS8|nr:hypothetical protein CERSUDRAFT_87057 [Gelatoporia subvermispora B]
MTGFDRAAAPFAVMHVSDGVSRMIDKVVARTARRQGQEKLAGVLMSTERIVASRVLFPDSELNVRIRNRSECFWPEVEDFS